MTDLVITHLTHPLGPPETLETLGDHWRPLATIGDMLENDQFPPNWSFSSRVAKGRQGSPMVAKGFQGPRGTQGMGEMSYNQIGHI